MRFPIPSPIIARLPATFIYLILLANVVDGDRYANDYDFFYIFYNGFLLHASIPHVRYLSGPPLLPQLEGVSPGLRGVPFRFFRWTYRRFLRKFKPAYEYHHESNYVINSRFTAGLFQEAHGVKLPIVHPPIKVSHRRFDDEDFRSRDTMTFFSRFVDYKRPELVLALARRYPGLRCVLMGGVSPKHRGYFEKLRARAREQGFKQVVFIDNPSDERVNQELRRTRYFIFPAVNEHFGMTTPEAIASGAIPFVHDSGGQREIVPNPKLRFSDSEFFDKFEHLISIPERELIAMRRELHQYIQQYTEEVFIEKMLAFLRPGWLSPAEKLATGMVA